MSLPVFQTFPLTNAAGAEIQGLDLSFPLSDDTTKRLRRIWLRHGVLFFRNQNLDPGQLLKVAKAFGMEVCAWSENLNLSHANDLEVLPMSKEDLLKNSDIISIHLVLGERYKNLITKKEFGMMKKTAFLINTSRGPIINENDLVEALKDEKIAGVGLDVYDKEPLPQDHKLRFLPNALLLPHIGYVTAENYSKFYSQMIENLESCLKNKPFRIIS